MKLPMIGALWVGAALAFAGPLDDIKSIHSQIAKGMLSGNAAAMSKLIMASTTPDFAAFLNGGQRIDRAGYIAQIKSQLAKTKYTAYSFALTPAAPGRAGMLITATLRFSSTMKDGKGKPHKQVGTVTYQEVWVLIGKTPKLRRLRLQDSLISTDGKPPVKTGGGPMARAREAF